jgi:hypothetical protein
MTVTASRPDVPRRPAGQRLPKSALRAWAWIAGAIALVLPWGILRAVPKPAGTARAAAVQRPVIVRRVIRRVIVLSPAPGVTRAAVAPPSSGWSGPVAAPAPAPATTKAS